MLPNLNISKPNSRMYLVISVLVLAVGLIVFVLVLPLTNRIRKNRAVLEANRSVILKQEQQLREFAEAEKKIAEITESLPVVKNLFPVRERSVIVVEAVEDALARAEIAAEISITDKKETETGRGAEKNEAPAVSVKTANLEQVPYTLSVGGVYRNLLNLFLYLENMPFLTQITDLNLAAESEGSDEGRTKNGFVSGTLKGVFFLKQK